MAKYYPTQTQQGVDTTPWSIIKQEALAIKNSIIAILTPDESLSNRQIRYWKGVLLPALVKDTGNSEAYWEMRLKLFVMPDEFAPEIMDYNGNDIYYIPSIKILNTKQMNRLIEGSVEALNSWGFEWVQLPDEELRKA